MAGMSSVGMSVFSDRACHVERGLRYLLVRRPARADLKETSPIPRSRPSKASRTMGPGLGTIRIEALWNWGSMPWNQAVEEVSGIQG